MARKNRKEKPIKVIAHGAWRHVLYENMAVLGGQSLGPVVRDLRRHGIPAKSTSCHYVGKRSLYVRTGAMNTAKRIIRKWIDWYKGDGCNITF